MVKTRAGRVMICLDLHFPVAHPWSKKARAAALSGPVLPTRKPDTDNVLKALCDAINGVVWNGDVRLVDVAMRKRCREILGVHVEMRPLHNCLIPVCYRSAHKIDPPDRARIDDLESVGMVKDP